jgi:hypothetical protein
MAMNTRLKEKDAWDIYYCVRHYPEGIDALLVKEIRPFLGNTLVQEDLIHISRCHCWVFCLRESNTILCLE